MYSIFIDDSILPLIYLDECKRHDKIEYYLMDSIYSIAFEPFLYNDLINIHLKNGEYHISIEKNIPVVSFYIDSIYIRVPYHKDLKSTHYFSFFALMYSLLSLKSVCYIASKIPFDKIDYSNTLSNVFMTVLNNVPIFNSEIENGTVLELTGSLEIYRYEYQFNVINSMG